MLSARCQLAYLNINIPEFMTESKLNAIEGDSSPASRLCECGCGTVVSRKKYRFTRGHYSRVTGNRDAAKKTSEKLKEGFATGRIKHRGALPADVMARIGADNSTRNKGKVTRKTEQQEWEKEKLRAVMAANPLTAKGVENRLAKWWHLRSPDNKTYRFKNLLEFVRTNPELFDEEDIQWREKGKCHQVCKASIGLAILSPRKKNPKGTWKGWTWVSITEQIMNDREDLLGRKSADS